MSAHRRRRRSRPPSERGGSWWSHDGRAGRTTKDGAAERSGHAAIKRSPRAGTVVVRSGIVPTAPAHAGHVSPGGTGPEGSWAGCSHKGHAGDAASTPSTEAHPPARQQHSDESIAATINTTWTRRLFMRARGAGTSLHQTLVIHPSAGFRLRDRLQARKSTPMPRRGGRNAAIPRPCGLSLPSRDVRRPRQSLPRVDREFQGNHHGLSDGPGLPRLCH